jgi:hypothetical protein
VGGDGRGGGGRQASLGFGRIVISESEAPNPSVNLVHI